MTFIVPKAMGKIKIGILLVAVFLMLTNCIHTKRVITNRQNSKVKNVLEDEAYWVAEVLTANLDNNPAINIS